MVAQPVSFMQSGVMPSRGAIGFVTLDTDMAMSQGTPPIVIEGVNWAARTNPTDAPPTKASTTIEDNMKCMIFM